MRAMSKRRGDVNLSNRGKKRSRGGMKDRQSLGGTSTVCNVKLTDATMKEVRQLLLNSDAPGLLSPASSHLPYF